MGCTDSKEDRSPVAPAIPGVPVLGDYFTLVKILGEGTGGMVYLAKDTHTQEDRAVKVLNMFETVMSTVKRESHMLQQLKHPCIVEFYGLYMKGHEACLVMDYYPGGSLNAARHRDAKHHGGDLVDTGTIQNIARGAVLAAEWLHQHLIVHRDIKAHNFLVDKRCLRDPAARVVLCDMGTCCRLTHENERMRRVEGTQQYWAPELHLADYGMKVDSWALGAMAFELIWEIVPSLKDESDAAGAWDQQVYVRNGHAYENAALKEWVCGLLTKDEEERLSTREALDHPFLQLVRSATEKSVEMPTWPQEEDTEGMRFKAVETCGHCAVAQDGKQDNDDISMLLGDSFASLGSLVEIAIKGGMLDDAKAIQYQETGATLAAPAAAARE